MSENNDYSYLLDLIKLAESSEERSESEKLNIKYEGEFLSNTNPSKVNVNLSYVLLKDTSYNISFQTRESIDEIKHKLIYENLNKQLDKTDFVISNNTEPNFRMPDSGYWIVMQNWDYGAIPDKWLESINDYVDQLWVSSNYVKNCFVNAGTPEEKIKVINNGVDSLYFNYHVEPFEIINTDKKKKLLFRGELNWNSGFDLLLKAYTDEFVRDEDVCLVVMSHARNVSSDYNKKIKSLVDLPDSPEILLIDEPEEQSNISGLYKSCDFIIHPYRAESYCLNILESMACGTPAIVTNFGSVLDYCNSENSLLVNSNIVYQDKKEIENHKTIDFPFWSEADIMDLRVKLRQAYEYDEDSYNALAQKASKSILDKFTWVKINDLIKENLYTLKDKEIKRDKQQKLNYKILDGLNALTSGDFDLSISQFQEAYLIDADNANLNFYMANLMLAKDNYTDSLRYISKSLERQKDNEDYNNLAGIIFYKLGHYKLAKKIFEKILMIMPEHSGARESLKAIESLSDEQYNSNGSEIDSNILEFFNDQNLNSSQLKKSSLSVCILTRNEQANIEKAIKSVKSIADEIIVLDTGSTDKTVEISKKEGAKVLTTRWYDDFSKARNELISYAEMDWILVLDADESLSDESTKKIKQVLLSLDNNKVYAPRITNFIDKNNIKEKQEHYVVRILPNHQGIKYIGEIHEYPVNSDGSLLESDNIKGLEILHYGYTSKSVKEKNKIERNKTILEKALDSSPDSPLINYYLSENYKDNNQFEKALFYAEQVVKDNNDEKYKNIFELAKLNIIDLLINLNKQDEARVKTEQYKNSLKNRPDFWFLAGSLEFNSKNYDKAIEYNKKALELRSEPVYSALDLGTIGWKPMALIAQSYKEKKDNKNTLIYLKRAIKESPQNLSLYYQLSELYSNTKELNLLENTIKTFIGTLDDISLANLLISIREIYFEKKSEGRLYKLLESVRASKLKGNNDEQSDYLADKMIEIYNDIFIKNESVMGVKYSIACCYEFKGDLENSKKLFEELISGNDFEVDSLHNLASIALTEKDLDKAERLYKKVLEIDEFHYDAYLSLAKLELVKGNVEKAREYMNELSEIDPDNKDLGSIEFEIAQSSGDKKLASDIYAAMLFKNKN